MHAVAAASEYFPATQGEAHATESPVVALYVPAEQSSQLVAPVLTWKWPAEQKVHAVAAAAEYFPTCDNA